MAELAQDSLATLKTPEECQAEQIRAYVDEYAALALEALSEARAAEELTALHSTVDRDNVILDKRSKSTSFKPAEEIVKFQVHPTDSTKTASIGA